MLRAGRSRTLTGEHGPTGHIICRRLVGTVLLCDKIVAMCSCVETHKVPQGYTGAWSSLQRQELYLIDYLDLDFARDDTYRKLTTGYLFQLVVGGVLWSPKKQTIVSLSTNKAEYVTLSTAAREVIWIRNLASDFVFIAREVVF